MRNYIRVVISAIFTLILCCAAVSRQTAAPRPATADSAPANAGQGEEPEPSSPPQRQQKPSDEPTLETNLKFLENQLSNRRAIDTTFHWTNEVTGSQGDIHAVFQITEFHGDTNTCHISFTIANPNSAIDTDLSFYLRDVEAVREATAEQYMKEIDDVSDPPEFVVLVKVANIALGREIWLTDENSANRVASALKHAVGLCSGGS